MNNELRKNNVPASLREMVDQQQQQHMRQTSGQAIDWSGWKSGDEARQQAQFAKCNSAMMLSDPGDPFSVTRAEVDDAQNARYIELCAGQLLDELRGLGVDEASLQRLRNDLQQRIAEGLTAQTLGAIAQQLTSAAAHDKTLALSCR